VTRIIPVQPIVRAAGFVTSLGGGGLGSNVRRAMGEAAASSSSPDDLQAWAGEAIAPHAQLGHGDLVHDDDYQKEPAR
jgi:hypothetical protein